MNMRMKVYTSLNSRIATRSIPEHIRRMNKLCGIVTEKIPVRQTIEQMARELGTFSDYFAAKYILSAESTTIAFDAITRDGVHVNSVHVTSPTECFVIAIDQLAGGTSEDYATHINSAIERIASVLSIIEDTSCGIIKKKLINKIKCTMTDRAYVNHATVLKLNEMWNSKLLETNCHLHPLDSIATKVRSRLASLQLNQNDKSCLAATVIYKLSKLRFKDNKGDPKGFKMFLKVNKLPYSLIPRYVGNRMNILFVTAEILKIHRTLILRYLDTPTCEKFKNELKGYLENDVTRHQHQILAIIGHLITIPWMQLFYTKQSDGISNITAFQLIDILLKKIKYYKENPLEMITTENDLFENTLTGSRLIFENPPSNFHNIMSECLAEIIVLIERQYASYYKLNITDALKETASSSRAHNIDAEEVMGMFSAAKENSPNATLSYVFYYSMQKK